MSLVVWDADNRELRTNRVEIAGRDHAVRRVSWEPGIRAGAVVAPGDLLATMRWDLGPPEPLNAPPGCAGVIEATNRRIDYERLHRFSDRLLSLAPPLGGGG